MKSIFKMVKSKSNIFFLMVLSFSFSPAHAHDNSRKNLPQPTQLIMPPPNDYKGCFSSVYAFGDSYTDTGNAYLMRSLQSFVQAFFDSRTHATTADTATLPGHRLSNGRLVIDYLCEALALPPLPPSELSSFNFSYGANFAIAGSTALTTGFFPLHKIARSLLWGSSPESMQTQINWFLKFKITGQVRFDDSLFWIGEFGGNDYARIYSSVGFGFSSSISIHVITEIAVRHVCTLLRALLDGGARYLVVQGLPPTGCLSLGVSRCLGEELDQLGCSGKANAVINAHNDLLQAKLEEIRLEYKDAMILYADYWKAYTTILQNHNKYNFEEPFKACCGARNGPLNFDVNNLCWSPGASACTDSSKYINWDGIHLTEAMHRQLADLFFNQDYCKPSFKDLIKMKKSKQFN